jgi:putative oxidoreductase
VASNGSADIGLLLLRILIGGLFFVHGAQKVFGVLDGQGLGTTATNLSGYGFAGMAGILAPVLGWTELIAGGLLVLGLLTPVASAALLSISIVAVAVKWGTVDIFASAGAESLEPDLLIGGGALALLFTGAGRAALDFGRAWQRRPMPYAWLFLIISVGVAAAVFFLLRR